MTAWLDAWAELLATLSRNPVRTGLTAAGVAWGMFMLVVMSGFGSGLEEGVRASLGRRATNAVWFWGRSTAMPWKGQRAGAPVRLQNSDLDAIQAEVQGVERVAAGNTLGGYRSRSFIRRGGRSGSFEMLGTTDAYRHIHPMSVGAGRYLNPTDLADRRRVGVLGATAAEELFADGEPIIGQQVEVAGAFFQVVGVFSSELPGDDGERAEAALHVPLTTFQQAYRQGDRVRWLAITGAPHIDAEALEGEVRAVLQQRHGVHPDDTPALGSRNGGAEFARLQNTFAAIRGLVLFVGGMTVLAGAFGVTNVMLVAVRERTREFGLRRAVGATAAGIRRMVLREAVLLTVVAGVVGLLCGVGVLEAARLAFGAEHAVLGAPRLDPTLILGAGGAMVLAGGIAGLLPAARAAAISPVDALRS